MATSKDRRAVLDEVLLCIFEEEYWSKGRTILLSRLVSRAGIAEKVCWSLVLELAEQDLVSPFQGAPGRSLDSAVAITEVGRQRITELMIGKPKGAMDTYAKHLSPVQKAVLEAVVQHELTFAGGAATRTEIRTAANRLHHSSLQEADHAIDELASQYFEVLSGADPSIRVNLRGLLASQWGQNSLTLLDGLMAMLRQDPAIRRYSWTTVRHSLRLPRWVHRLFSLVVTKSNLGRGITKDAGDDWWSPPKDLDMLLDGKSAESYIAGVVAAENAPARTASAAQPSTSSMKTPSVFETYSQIYTYANRTFGEGGCGRVVEVRDESGDVYALKWLLPDRVSTAKRKRFKNELAFCSRANHHRIIRVLDAGFVTAGGEKCPFYVMQKYAGTLRIHMQRGLRPVDVLPIFLNMLDGVEAAHICGIWHRDLKPENVLCLATPTDLVIADFGIAHFTDDLLETSVETQQGAWLANMHYAAPEQRRKDGVVDQRCDIYALGLILNELFTNDLPQGKGHKLIADIAPEFGYLDDIVDWMLQRDPSKRPNSIDSIKSELIHRGREEVSRQKLDHLKQTLFGADESASFSALKEVDSHYENGILRVVFDRDPPVEWLELFKQPPEGYNYQRGYEPHQIGFNGATASIRVPRSIAQSVHGNIMQWTAIANRIYPEHVREAPTRILQRERAAQEERVRIAEEEAAINAQLKAARPRN